MKKKKKKKKKKVDRIGAASWPASDLGPPAPPFFGAFDHLPSQHSRIVVKPEAIAEPLAMEMYKLISSIYRDEDRSCVRKCFGKTWASGKNSMVAGICSHDQHHCVQGVSKSREIGIETGPGEGLRGQRSREGQEGGEQGEGSGGAICDIAPIVTKNKTMAKMMTMSMSTKVMDMITMRPQDFTAGPSIGSGTCPTPGYGLGPKRTHYCWECTPTPPYDGRSYTPGVGVGYETPSQQQNAYDSDQDRDTDQIRRRETEGYESAHGEETSIREGLLAGFASMDPRSFRCSGNLLISCRGVILMLRDAVIIGGRLAHGRSHRAFSSSSYEQNLANLAAAQMEPASGPSNPSIYAATDQEHGDVVRSLGTQYTWGFLAICVSSSARMRRQQLAFITCKMVRVLHTSTRYGAFQLVCKTKGVTVPWDLRGTIIGAKVRVKMVEMGVLVYGES
ncbi:hypothetical protein BDR22DRAFT_826482 [Usnea florida]